LLDFIFGAVSIGPHSRSSAEQLNNTKQLNKTVYTYYEKIHYYINGSMCDRGLRDGLRTAGQTDVWPVQRSYGTRAGGVVGRSSRDILY
jgi:hypothetical protein